MIRCVLFDLDGTLVHFEYDDFLKEYINAITRTVATFVEPTQFAKALLASTDAMIRNQDPSLKNSQVFQDDFFRRVRVPENVLMPVFEFLRNELLSLRIPVSPSQEEMLEFLIQEGYDVVIATNAVFRLKLFRTDEMGWNQGPHTR